MLISAIPLLYWHWFGLSVLLILLEFTTVTSFLYWMAVAAVCVGVIVFFSPSLDQHQQFYLYVSISLFTMLLGNWYFKNAELMPAVMIKQRNRQYLGRVLMLSEAIQEGVGVVRVDDTLWRVKGQDLPAGSTIKVIGVDGTFLLVEKYQK